MLKIIHQITNNITLATLYVSFILIALLVAIVYLIGNLSKHRKEKKSDEALIQSFIIKTGENEKENTSLSWLFESLLVSRYRCIKTYHITQLTSKLSGILGLAFSALGLAAFADGFIVAEKEMQILVSLSSIIAVIIALYISPDKKYSQYVEAWRSYNALVGEMKANIYYYHSGQENQVLASAQSIQKRTVDIQKQISSDEL